MKQIYPILLLLLLSASVFGQTQSRGVFVEGQSKKIAVLIGVNDYQNMRKLRYAKNDVNAVREQLYKIGFEQENVFRLVCGEATAELPTKENILSTIRHAVELAREGDMLLIAMAGHGIEANDGQSRFCSVETQPDNLLTTTVPINEIFEAVGNCKASFKLMMIDACRDDPFRGRAAFGAKTIDTIDNPPKGALLLQSCAKGEMSLEDDDVKQGIFSYYIAEGLSGKAANKEGQVTLLGLADYVIDKTRRRAFELETRRQVPYIKGELTNFVLSNVAVPTPNRESATVSPALSFTAEEQAEIEKFLEMHGNDVKNLDEEGRTLLYHAAYLGNIAVIKYLISQGADVNAKNSSGVTALHGAANKGHIESAKLLVSQGANVNIKHNKSQDSPLHRVADIGCVEIAKLLMSQGADVNATDDGGWTPLHRAASNGQTEFMKYLVSAGANVNAKKNDGKTPLDCAKQNNHTEMIRYLRSVGGR